jgi:hypothetical protein
MAFICEVEESDKSPNPERQLSSISISPFGDFDAFLYLCISFSAHENESDFI